GCSTRPPWSANSGVQVVPISATSGTLPPAIAVTNLSWACAHGTNSMLTVVPACWPWKSVPYCLTTFWTAGEPGSLIHLSIGPESCAAWSRVVACELALWLDSPPPRPALTAAAAAVAAPPATLRSLTRPPPPRVGVGCLAGPPVHGGGATPHPPVALHGR